MMETGATTRDLIGRELWFSTVTSQPPVARKFASRSLSRQGGEFPIFLVYYVITIIPHH
jgi:hypothetical protein